MKLYTLVVTALLISSSLVFGQSIEFDKKNFEDKEGLKVAKNNLEEGDKLYEQGAVFYKDALPFYQKAQEFNPNNADLNYKLGKCYLQSAFKTNALKHLEKAVSLNPEIDIEAQYYLGVAYHIAMDWDKAIAAYSKYQKTTLSNPDPMANLEMQNRISQCMNGRELVKKPLRVFIDNLGKNINTEYNEYGAVVSADESVLLFTARQPNSTGGGIDPGLNEHFEDMYISYKQPDGQWSKAVNLPKQVNSSDHDAVSAISADGQRFIIYLGSSNAGDLFESVLTGNEWSKPESLGKNINSKYHEPSACYSPDGNTIYFVSDMPGGQGQHDIYVSKKDDKGRWGEAVNLGKTINTSFNEEGVFMHPDGKTLYFSSEGHKSMGGFDIFKTVLDPATNSWSTPENVGYPVNTADDDVFFVLSANGRHGYYMSLSADGFGRRDLYMITFLGDEKPMVQNNEDNLIASHTAPVKEQVKAEVVSIKEAQLTILKGVITDALTQKPLEATIEIVDNQMNQVIASFTSNSATGKYLVSLPAGKNYGIAVKKEGYLFHSENFDIPNTAAFQQVTKDVELKNIAVGSKIVLKNIFFDFDKATLRPESTNELQRLTKLLNDVPTLKIEISGHTDSKGANDYNKTLSDNRAKAVVDYLIKAGIASNRLVYKGYGEEQPISTNETEEGRQLNRRTEFKILSM
jgi:outer membrane protein OmpA-like peptidoglycan-associated protein/tetratricopeptide (TPR) repeat protein